MPTPYGTRKRRPVRNSKSPRFGFEALFETLEERLAPAILPLTAADASLLGDTANGESGIPSISSDGNIVAFQSRGSNLIAGIEENGQVYAYNRAQDTQSLVTVDTNGRPVSVGGANPVVSSNGQYVLFMSQAAGLVSQNVGSGFGDVQLYLRDLVAETTTLISVTPDGAAGGNADSGGNTGSSGGINPSLYAISDNNRYVAFWSSATNLIAQAPANPDQLYVRDLLNGTTMLVSVDANGDPAGPNPSFGSIPFSSLSVHNDGSVLFTTTVDGLVPEDTNGFSDVYLHDGTTQLVSVNTTGSAGNGRSTAAFWTQDGNRVFFSSQANDLIAGGSGFFEQLYVRDIGAGTTSLLSHANGAPGSPSNGSVESFTISRDGKYVAFESFATNLVAGDLNSRGDIFLRDTMAGTTTIISNAAGGGQANDGSFTPIISGDGSKIFYGSDASNLVTGFVDNNSFYPDYFLYDRLGGSTELVTADLQNPTTGGDSTDNISFDVRYASLSNDGSAVAFRNLSSNLVANDNNRASDVFVYDSTGNHLISARGDGVPAPYLVSGAVQAASADGRYVVISSISQELNPDAGFSFLQLLDRVTGEFTPIDPSGFGSTGGNVRMSPDGRFVVFTAFQVKLFDRVNGTLEVISKTPSGNDSTGSFSGEVDVSADGRYVAFVGNAADLVSGFTDPNANQLDVYLRDRQTQTTHLVNRATGTTTTSSNRGYGQHVQISANGAKVVFDSTASDLAPNDNNGVNGLDAFAFDVATQTVSLISGNVSGQAAGAREFSVSANGQLVAFASLGAEIVAGVTGASVYVRDLVLGTTQLVDVNRTGSGPGNGAARLPQITPDGQFVLFQSFATDLTAGNTAAFSNGDIYVRDLVAGQTFLVSAATDGVSGGNRQSRLHEVGGEQRQQISPNGRYVAFESSATDLVPGFVDANGLNDPDLFVRDVQTGTTLLVSVNRSGTAGGNSFTTVNGLAPQFIALDDGRVLFSSFSSDLANAVDSNRQSDAFHFDPSVASGGTIRGTVFNDANGDGARQQNESGIADNVVVFLDADTDGQRDAGETFVSTGIDGAYAFVGVALGPHRIVLENDAASATTSPAAGFHTVTLTTDGEVISDRDFGRHTLRADLVVEAVAVQPNGAALDVTWTVANRGELATSSANWQDAVFLSSTPTLGLGAILLGTVAHTGALAADGTYQQQATFNAIVPGTVPFLEYYVVVQTDRGFVLAEADRANNERASDDPTELSVAELTLGVAAGGQFTADQVNHFYRVDVPTGGSLLVTLDRAGSDGTTSLYIARNRLPSPFDFDVKQLPPAGADARAIVPFSVGGTYYILARSDSGPPTAFNITASQSAPIELVSSEPASGGNAGLARLRIHGLNLSPDAQFMLVQGGTTIDADAVDFRDPSLALATFDVSGQSPGVFDLIVVDGGETFTLPGAYELFEDAAAEFEARILGPALVRAGRTAHFSVEITNPGNSLLAMPMLTITSPTNAPMGRTFDDISASRNLLLAPLSRDTDLLADFAPGETRTYPVQFTVPNDGLPLEFSVRTTTVDEPTVIDYDAFESEFIPQEVRDRADWAGISSGLRQQLGATWGDFVQFLRATAPLIPASDDPFDVRSSIDLALRRAILAGTTSMQGTLRAPGGRADWADKTVSATERDTGALFITQSLNDGSYLFEELTPGTYDLRVAGMVHDALAVIVTPGQTAIASDLTVTRGRLVLGRATAQESGAGLAGAAIAVIRNGVAVAHAVSGSSGNFQITNVAPGNYRLTATAPGRADTEIAQVTVGDDNLVQDIALLAESMITGTVNAESGGPANSVVEVILERVSSVSDDPLGRTMRIALNSDFEFSGVPDGTYRIVVEAAGYVRQYLPEFTVTTGSVTEIGEVELLRGGSVEGTVVAHVPGYTLESSMVGLFRAGVLIGVAQSDADGVFGIPDVAPDNYTLRLGHSSGFSAPVPVTVTAGQTVTDIVIELFPGGFVSGAVTDSITGDPIAGLGVVIAGADGVLQTVFTDTSGVYRSEGLEIGSYTVALRSGGPATPFQITSLNGPDVTADFQASSFASLTGRLLTNGGQPISSGAVEVFENGERIGLGTTNAAGQFAFAFLRGGTFDFRASAAGASFADQTGILISAGSPVVLDFVAGTAEVEVDVQDIMGPTTVSAVLLRMRGTVGEFAGIVTASIPGSLQFGNLEAGDYVLILSNDTQARGATLSFSLATGENLALVANLGPLAALVGTVEDNVGQPIANASIQLVSQTNRSLAFTVFSNADGTYAIPGVPAGSYNVTVIAESFVATTVTGLAVGAANVTQDATLMMGESRVIGRVLDGQGQPMLFDSVTIRDSDGNVLGASALGADGTFEILTAVGAGLVLRFEAPGFAPVEVSGLTLTVGGMFDVGDLTTEAIVDVRAVPPPPQPSPGAERAQPQTAGRSFYDDPSLQISTGNPVTTFFGTSPPAQQPVGESPVSPATQKMRDATARAEQQARALAEKQAYIEAIKNRLEIARFIDLKDPTSEVTIPPLPNCPGKTPPKHLIDLRQDVLSAMKEWSDLIPAVTDALNDLEDHNEIGEELWFADMGGVAAALSIIGLAFLPAGVALVQTTVVGGVEYEVVTLVATRAQVAIGASVANIIQGVFSLIDAATDAQRAASREDALAKINRMGGFGANLASTLSDTLTVANKILPKYVAPISAAFGTGLNVASFLFTLQNPLPRFAAQLIVMDKAEQAFQLTEQRLFAKKTEVFRRLKEYTKAVLDFELNKERACQMPPEDPPPPPPGTNRNRFRIDSVRSSDPNDISGPAGFGSTNHIRPAGSAFPYTIRFENDPMMATAPAQEVFITHTLDMDLDPATFVLGDFGFGSISVAVPPGVQEYQTRVEMTNLDSSPLFVDISVTFDQRTREVLWTFRSVDPDTGGLPDGVFDGFLPPNDETGRGDGFVSFFVKPNLGLPTGTTIDAQASIVFDTNDAILTNIFVNTIDVGVPASSVNPLPAESPQVFLVSWESEDDAGGPQGSGVATFDIFVSIDNAPFALWLDDTPNNSAVYTGQVGHTYAFFSVATDNVGNVEAEPATFDTETFTVVAFDFGDAPDPLYPTLLTNDGARHVIGTLFLGATVDADLDGQQNAAATGDDQNGSDDEDGVTLLSALRTGHFGGARVSASAPGRLDAWIDWNADGDWSDAGEQAADSVLLAAGDNILSFLVPASAALGDTYARFRLSSAGGLEPTGQADDGEVEDYRVTITAATSDGAPVLQPVMPNPVTVLHGGTGKVTLNATDADNDFVVFTAQAQSIEFALDQQLGFYFSGSDYLNYLGRDERWFRAANDANNWYFLEPDGDLFKWLGGSSSQFVARLNPVTYGDLNLILGATSTAVPVNLTVMGNMLSIDPDDSFEGSFVVAVTADDGQGTDAESFLVNVVNTPPDLQPIADRFISPSVGTTTVTLNVIDPDPSAMHTFSATAESPEYLLDQQFGFTPGGSDYLDYLGRDERWFRAANDGNNWYFIEPDGEVFKWLGGSSAQRVGQVDPAAHANLALITNAQPGLPGVTLTINGNQLEINATGFVGRFGVIVSVIDAPTGVSDTERFLVNVANGPPVLQPIADQFVPTSQSTRVVALVATEADPGDTVTFSASAQSREFLLDEQFDFTSGGSDYFDYLGRDERWFRAANDNNRWYFIEPDGEVFEWLGGSNAERVGQVGPAAHANLNLLLTPVAGVAGVTLTVDNNADELTIQLDPGFLGTFQVTVTASDGTNAATETFLVTIEPGAPVLAPVGDFDVNQTAVVPFDVDATHPDNAPMTFTVHGETLAYVLDQELGFFSTGNLFTNFLDRGEKWFRSAADANSWYFIEPDGEVFKWLGGANGELIARLPTAYHANVASLFDAQPMSALTLVVTQVGANPARVQIDPMNTVRDLFVVVLTASDGVRIDRDNLLVDVTDDPMVVVRAGDDRVGAVDELLIDLDVVGLIELLDGDVT